MFKRIRKTWNVLFETNGHAQNGHAEELPIAKPTGRHQDRKNQLLIGLPCGWNLMCPDMVQYAIWLVNEIQDPNFVKQYGVWTTKLWEPELHGIRNFHLFRAANSRIEMCRNAMADATLREGYTHLLMIDPDMSMDDYRSESWWQPFLSSGIEFLSDHPCSILGAPYAGWFPDPVVHVFGENSKTGDPKRITTEQAAEMVGTGWQQVKAIGTGLMLMDRAVLEKMKPPFFLDQYYDHDKRTKLRFTQDAYFCMKAAHFGIKTYVNWNCPCAHWQLGKVHFPGLKPAKQEWQSHVQEANRPADAGPVTPVLQAPEPCSQGQGRAENACPNEVLPGV